MSKEDSKAPISKATNAAEDVNNDADLEKSITSEFIIISSESEAENNVLVSYELVAIPSTTKKKISSKDRNKRKTGPSTKMINLIMQSQTDQKNAELKADEEAKRNQRLREEHDRKEQENLRLEKEYRQKMREKEKQRIQRQRENGSYLTKQQRKKYHCAQIQLAAAGIQIPTRGISQLAISSLMMVSIESENQQISEQENLEQYDKICENHYSSEGLRAPVICVLGHVDAGKTTILDNLRRTHVQDNEAGGITQQIGATNVPLETIYERTKMCRKMISREGDFIVPGLLIIDTPGHETFKNLRVRGSSLCDLAILVVDIMHGLAPQTIESIQLLTEKQTPFIIALNKIDLLYDWKTNNEKDVELVLQEQSTFTQNHFEQRCNHIIVQFAEQGLNVALYWKNSDPNEFYSMVPTSAHSGDGMGSLIALIIEKCQTTLVKRIIYTDELQATVMEVKTIDGLGTTIDVALVNGCLSVGDKIIIAGQEAPIVTKIRRILIPESNQELRVTNQYQTNEKIQGTCGIKILAKDLEKSMAGFPLFVVRTEDEIKYFKNEIEIMLKTTLNSIELKDKGVYIQASTLGSLEAFLQLLKTSHIPYSGINIGPVHRRDVIRASAQLEKDVEWASILAFDVKIERDAQEYANTIGVKILQNDEIYRLRDMFISHREQLKTVNQEKYRHIAVFPCKLKILPQWIFNSHDPIVCAVHIEDGFIKLGTPVCVPSKNCIDLGRIVSIEKNYKSLDIAQKGSEVCIKIETITGEIPKMYGRHFDENDILMSKISRESIDVVTAYFREEMQRSDWELMIELKQIFQII